MKYSHALTHLSRMCPGGTVCEVLTCSHTLIQGVSEILQNIFLTYFTKLWCGVVYSVQLKNSNGIFYSYELL